MISVDKKNKTFKCSFGTWYNDRPNSRITQATSIVPRPIKDNALNLAPFYQRFSHRSTTEQKNVQVQTSITISFLADDFEMRTLYETNRAKQPIKKSSSVTDLQQSKENTDDCFLLQNKDFYENYYEKPPQEKTGLNLHKSYSDISIVSNLEMKKAQPVNKTKHCRECFHLQHRCPECNMKFVLRKHLMGRTTQKEFNDFIVKCFESSTEYRQIFNNALDTVGRELGLTDKNLKLDAHKKSTSSIDYQVMMLNKNRALIGGMKKQNIDSSSKSMKNHKKKQHYEKVEKYNPSLSVPKKQVYNKQSDSSVKEKPMIQETPQKLTNQEQKMFVIDKNDPTLIEIMQNVRKHSNDPNQKQLDSCESKSNQTNDNKSTKKLSQFHLDSTYSEGSAEIAQRKVLVHCHLEPLTILCKANHLTVHNFVTDVIIGESLSVEKNEDLNNSKDSPKNLKTEKAKRSLEECRNLLEKIFNQYKVLIEEQNKIAGNEQLPEDVNFLSIESILSPKEVKNISKKSNEKSVIQDMELTSDQSLSIDESRKNSGVEMIQTRNKNAENVADVKKKKNSGTSQSNNKEINLALKLTMSNISNLNDMKSGSNHSSDNEFY